MKRYQLGLTSVEFAFVATTLIVVLFAVIEFGRLLFTYAALGEGTRRAARLAAVCPIGSPGIVNAATGFGDLPGFTAGNVSVQYLNAAGAATANYANIQYVQVQVVGYTIPLNIPFFWPTVTAPSFAVTLPRESLGVTPTNVGFCG
jgi:Flp pilus assembly protein TadG